MPYRAAPLPLQPQPRLTLLSQRTAVCKKTLNPYWGEEFKFEVADDSVLQNEPIEFKVITIFQGLATERKGCGQEKYVWARSESKAEICVATRRGSPANAKGSVAF